MLSLNISCRPCLNEQALGVGREFLLVRDLPAWHRGTSVQFDIFRLRLEDNSRLESGNRDWSPIIAIRVRRAH
jgi:hypothetical protein